MSIPGNGHLPASTDLPDHSSSASDSEPEADGDYRPISGAATDSDTDPDPDPAPHHHRLGSIGNGVSELDLDSGDDDDDCEGADGEDAVAEEEGLRLGEEAARAFSEDDRRRRAPLPAGSAERIVDAMRGVEFPGAPPPWAGSVPEDQWLDRLRSLRAGAGAGHPN
uniref:Male-enhanced antigen 1 n=1 Tax=Oryza punctata TaxID=4537 RepID=A0A0E0JK74_ORYPU